MRVSAPCTGAHELAVGGGVTVGDSLSALQLMRRSTTAQGAPLIARRAGEARAAAIMRVHSYHLRRAQLRRTINRMLHAPPAGSRLGVRVGSALVLASAIVCAYACDDLNPNAGAAPDAEGSAIDAAPSCVPWVVADLSLLVGGGGQQLSLQYTFVGAAEDRVKLARNETLITSSSLGGSCNCQSTSTHRGAVLYDVGPAGEVTKTEVAAALGHVSAVDGTAVLHVTEETSQGLCRGPACPDSQPSSSHTGPLAVLLAPSGVVTQFDGRLPCRGAPMATAGGGAYAVALVAGAPVAPDAGPPPPVSSVVRFDPTSGTTVELARSDASFARCLVTDTGTLFYVTGKAALHRRSLADDTDVELATGISSRALALTASTIFVLTSAGEIAGFDRTTGAPGARLAKIPGGSEPVFLAATDDRLLVWSERGLGSTSADGSNPATVGTCPLAGVVEMTTDRSGHAYLLTTDKIFIR